MFRLILPNACLLISLLTCAAGAEDWNQWRGPNRDGHLPSSPPLLSALPAGGLSPVWTSDAEIPTGGGGGWSCPVVAGGRAYVFAHVKNKREGVDLSAEKFSKLDEAARDRLGDEERQAHEQSRREEQRLRRERQFQYEEQLHCFDAQTGRPLWVNKRASRMTRFPQSASPAVFDGVAFVHGARGLVRAIDATSGEDLWETQLPGEFDDQPHPSSAAVDDGVVVVVAGRLFGLDASDGKVLWQGEDEIGGDYASPAFWPHDDRHFAIAHAGSDTVCVDIADGKTQWRVESQAGRSSPVVVGDRLITYGNSRKGGVRCFALSPSGGELLWTNTAVADEGCSPVVVDGCAYVHGDRRLVCIHMETGQTEWRRELDIDRPRYTSLIAADGQVLFAADGLLSIAADPDKCNLLVDARFDKEGRLASQEHFRKLLKMDELEQTAEGQREAESLWRKQITAAGPAQCVSPAMSDGRLYLRLKNNRVACYDLRARR